MFPPRQANLRTGAEGLDKIRLEPHETKHVSVILNARAFSLRNASMVKRWRLVPGLHQILVGESSREIYRSMAIHYNSMKTKLLVRKRGVCIDVRIESFHQTESVAVYQRYGIWPNVVVFTVALGLE